MMTSFHQQLQKLRKLLSVHNRQAINRPLEPKHKRNTQGWVSVPIYRAITAVALQVGCSYLHLDSRVKEPATYWTEIASKPSKPRNLRHLKLTRAKGYRLKVCTLALNTVCNSYDSSSRGNRTAPRLVPKPLQRRTVQSATAYHSRPTEGLESLASKNNLSQ